MDYVLVPLLTFLSLYSSIIKKSRGLCTCSPPHFSLTLFQYYEQGNLKNNATYMWTMYWFHALFALGVFPLIIIVTLNAMMIVGLRRSMRRRRSMIGRDDSDNSSRHITIMMIVVAITFTICNLPACITILIEVSMGANEFRSWSGFDEFNGMCNILQFSNAAWNFWLYCAFSSKFRLAFVQAIGCARLLSRSRRKPSAPIPQKTTAGHGAATEAEKSRGHVLGEAKDGNLHGAKTDGNGLPN